MTVIKGMDKGEIYFFRHVLGELIEFSLAKNVMNETDYKVLMRDTCNFLPQLGLSRQEIDPDKLNLIRGNIINEFTCVDTHGPETPSSKKARKAFIVKWRRSEKFISICTLRGIIPYLPNAQSCDAED